MKRDHRGGPLDVRQSVRQAERRQAARSRAAEGRIRLAWRDGAAERRVDAAILDVSLGGLRLVADGMPGAGVVAWVLLVAREDLGWVEARVVGVKRSWLGPHAVRLAFATPCSYDFYTAVAR